MTVDHPILVENLKDFFPNLDLDILPKGFAYFTRTVKPRPGRFEVVEESGYRLLDPVVDYNFNDFPHPCYTDNWISRSMTDEEKSVYIAQETENFERSFSEMKAYAERYYNLAGDTFSKEQWQKYKTKLDQWVLEDVYESVIPNPPLHMSDGTIIVIYDVES